MSKEYNIKWTKNQRKRLDLAARKYNNAIRKAIKANPLAAEFLPKEVSFKELKSSITTRRALNNTVNSLTRITKQGALDYVRQDDGSITTKYERKEFSILKSVRERKKSMLRKKINSSKSQIGSIDDAKLMADKRKIDTFSAKSLRRFIDTQQKELNKTNKERTARYVNNYISAIESVFGGYEEYDDKLKAIKDKMSELYEEDSANFINMLDAAPDVKFIYDPIARGAKLDTLYEYWCMDVSGGI